MITVVMLSTVQKWKILSRYAQYKDEKEKRKRLIIDKWKDLLNPILFFMAGIWFCPDWPWLIETYYAMKWAVDKVIKTSHLYSLYKILTFTYDY